MLDYALTPEQLIVIRALSTGATITQAAEEVGIHRNTIANWRRNQIPFLHAFFSLCDLLLNLRASAQKSTPDPREAPKGTAGHATKKYR